MLPSLDITCTSPYRWRSVQYNILLPALNSLSQAISLVLTVFSTGCVLYEENFSMKCRKHKVEFIFFPLNRCLFQGAVYHLFRALCCMQCELQLKWKYRQASLLHPATNSSCPSETASWPLGYIWQKSGRAAELVFSWSFSSGLHRN